MDDNKLKEEVERTLGISSLPEGVKEELIARAGQLALERALTAVMEKVPEGKREELMAISKEGHQNKLMEFMKKEVPNVEDVIKSEVWAIVTEIKNKN